jgi:hypothetical protein
MAQTMILNHLRMNGRKAKAKIQDHRRLALIKIYRNTVGGVAQAAHIVILGET